MSKQLRKYAQAFDRGRMYNNNGEPDKASPSARESENLIDNLYKKHIEGEPQGAEGDSSDINKLITRSGHFYSTVP